MDGLENGAVLVSFGTLARSSEMPKGVKNAVLEAFRVLKNVSFSSIQKFLFQFGNVWRMNVFIEKIVFISLFVCFLYHYSAEHFR